MNSTLQRGLTALAVGFILSVAAWTVWQFEQTLQQGRTVLLELAPVDPRSMMQGDYMALAFALDRQLPDDAGHYRYAWLQLDAQGVAGLHSVSNQLPGGPDLLAVLIRPRRFGYTLGPNGFFFAEGTAAVYENARYGRFRVDSGGKTLLTSLLDDKLQLLGDNQR